MPTLEEVKEIIKTGYADMSGQELKYVDIYNVEETTTGTYIYDASVYFRETDGGQASDDFHNQVQEDPSAFQTNLKNKIQEKRQDITVSNMSVDSQSGRFTRSLNKGKSKPNFDKIVPTIQNFNVHVQNPDFLEIKNVTLVKDVSGIDVTFAINTNVTNEKIYWRAKLATVDLDDGSDAFVDFLKSNANANQKQGHFTFNIETNIGPKSLAQAYTSLTVTTDTFDPNVDHFVYIMVYLANEPSFFTIYSTKIEMVPNTQASSLTYPQNNIFFRLNPKLSNSVISEHTTTITGSGTISETETINGHTVFEGIIKTNIFPHNSTHNYSVAFVTAISDTIGSWGAFFEFSISNNTPRDNGFIIERHSSFTHIGSQTNGAHTPFWNYDSFVNVPVIFFATMEGGTHITFKVFNVSTGELLHEGSKTTAKSVHTADGPVLIGTSSADEKTNSPFGEFIFYDRLLSDTEETQLISYLVSEWQ